MRNLADAGDDRAEIVLKVIGNPSKMLSAILIGNNIVNIYASSLATLLAGKLWGNELIGLATGVLTLFILVFGEITPKTVATISAETIALRFAKIIHLLMIILTPVIYIVNHLSFLVLKLLRVDPNKRNDTITEDELRTIVEVSHEEGVIESGEKKMINNVFNFGDAVAKDIMVPRISMSFVNADATYKELLECFRNEKYTRFPVYEETTDHVIGVINMKDVFLADGKEPFLLRSYLRAPLYTYEFKRVSELMFEMQQAMPNIVIVLDEYGATAGLITLEDMLEEIVGEIRDEYDEDEESAVREISPKEYIVEGSMKLDDLDERLELRLKSTEYDSVGGVIIGMLDHLPEEGEDVVIENVRLVVDKIDRNRIDKVHLYILNYVEAYAAQKKEEREQREAAGKES